MFFVRCFIGKCIFTSIGRCYLKAPYSTKIDILLSKKGKNNNNNNNNKKQKKTKKQKNKNKTTTTTKNNRKKTKTKTKQNNNKKKQKNKQKKTQNKTKQKKKKNRQKNNNIITIINYGTWQPVQFQLVSRSWTGSKMKWFLPSVHLACDELTAPVKCTYLPFRTEAAGGHTIIVRINGHHSLYDFV